MFLCCYVVKIAKAQKGGRTSVHFEHGQLCLHVQKLLFFFGGGGESSFSAFLVPKRYKTSPFEDLEN